MNLRNKILIILLILLTVLLLIVIGLVTFYKNISNSSFKYAYVGDVHDGLVSVSDGTYYGYIDSSGKIIFPLENKLPNKIDDDSYLSNFYFIDGLAKYYKDGKYGVINSAGEIIISNLYDDLTIYSDDIIVVNNSDGSYIINSSNIASSSKYLQIYVNKNDFEHFIVANSELKYGIVDINDNEIISFDYDSINYIYNFSENDFIYVLNDDDVYELYSSELSKIEIDNIKFVYWYEDGIICYADNNDIIHTYNIVDNKVETYDSKYDFVYYYTNNYAYVSSNGYYGYIDKNKNIAIDLSYNYSAGIFIDKYATVCNAIDDTLACNIIDENGKEMLDTTYREIYIYNKNIIKVIDNDNNVFIINYKGEKLTDDYEMVDFLEDINCFVVKSSDGKYGVLNYNYDYLYNLEYDNIKYNDNYFILKKESEFYIRSII